MKLKLLILSFLLLKISGQLLSQAPVDYFNYYLNIYKAEEKICENKLDSALYFYKKTFNNYSYKFYIDIYNAAICAEQLNDYESLDYFLKVLTSYGYDYHFINDVYLSKLDSLNNYKSFNTLDSLKVLFEKDINVELAKECRRRVDLDQSLNRKWRADNNAESIIEFHNQIYYNMDWLVGIIDSIGFPNRNLIGYEVKNGFSSAGIMIIHFYQQQTQKVYNTLKGKEPKHYPEEYAVNQYDSIPVLEILSNQVKLGKMYLGHHINLHNAIRSLNDGKYIYNYFYNSDTYPSIFNPERDKILIDISAQLENKIDEYNISNEPKFLLGKSLYSLHSMYK